MLATPHVSKFDSISQFQANPKVGPSTHASGALLVELVGHSFGLCANQLAAVHLERVDVLRIFNLGWTTKFGIFGFTIVFYHQISVHKLGEQAFNT